MKTGATGFRVVRVNSEVRSFTLVEIDYWADPDRRHAEWAAQARKRQPSAIHWRREFERDWTTPAGKAFYPEFADDPGRFVRTLHSIPAGWPVYRGWDFGYRRPACVWMLRSPSKRRLWVVRELMPEDVDTYVHRDLVLWCSGQRDREFLARRGPKALSWAQTLDDGPCPPPWFPPNTNFVDYAGPEALQVGRTVEHEHAARTDTAILALEGIHLQIYSSSPEARELVVRSLFHPLDDGSPALLVDPACDILIRGLKGGISYPDATVANPLPGDPRRDGFFEHLHDAFGYAAAQVCPVEEGGRPAAGEGQVVEGIPFTKTWSSGGAKSSRRGRRR